MLMSHSIESADGSHIVEILGDEIPLVQFDRVFDDLPGAKVVSTNFDGSYKAAKHLADNGYRKIGTVAGYLTAGIFTQRLAGYRKALEDSGMPYDDSIVFKDSIVRETGYNAALKALEAGCDALYCVGDFAALGAVEALKKKGVSIPRDFGIVGTANETFTSLISPSLSSLGQNPLEMGRRTALAFLEGMTETVSIPMILHIRESSNRKSICLK